MRTHCVSVADSKVMVCQVSQTEMVTFHDEQKGQVERPNWWLGIHHTIRAALGF